MLNLTQYNYNQQSYNPAFGAKPIESFPCEKTLNSAELLGRKIVVRVYDLFTKDNKKPLYEKLLNTETNSTEYIETSAELCRKLATKDIVNLNIEDNRLEEIAKSGKPHIFIMNHDNQKKDPQMLSFVNTILNEEYLYNGQGSTCPRQKIVMNKDIVLSQPKKKRAVFEKFGAIPVDINIFKRNNRENAVTMIKLMKDFSAGKSNIFIFPEGAFSVMKNATLLQKFQTGVAEMVTKLTSFMDEVRVTPIGFAYGTKAKAGENSIYIGDTVVFKKEGKHITSTRGNISSKFANEGYKNFFKNKQEAVLTNNSIPVEGREQSKYVAGILCENLDICKQEAKAVLENDETSPIFAY